MLPEIERALPFLRYNKESISEAVIEDTIKRF